MICGDSLGVLTILTMGLLLVVLAAALTLVAMGTIRARRTVLVMFTARSVTAGTSQIPGPIRFQNGPIADAYDVNDC